MQLPSCSWGGVDEAADDVCLLRAGGVSPVSGQEVIQRLPRVRPLRRGLRRDQGQQHAAGEADSTTRSKCHAPYETCAPSPIPVA